MVLDKLVYQMAVGGGGTPLDIVERAELIQAIFEDYGLKLVEVAEDE